MSASKVFNGGINDHPSTGLFVLPQQWDACVASYYLLKLFHDATKFFSGISYLTSHMVMIRFCNICMQIVECEKVEILKAIIPLKMKWLK